jgi:hypothetical protein
VALDSVNDRSATVQGLRGVHTSAGRAKGSCCSSSLAPQKQARSRDLMAANIVGDLMWWGCRAYSSQDNTVETHEGIVLTALKERRASRVMVGNSLYTSRDVNRLANRSEESE